MPRHKTRRSPRSRAREAADAPIFEAAWRLGGPVGLRQAVVQLGRSCWRCPACDGKGSRWVTQAYPSAWNRKGVFEKCNACVGIGSVHVGAAKMLLASHISALQMVGAI